MNTFASPDRGHADAANAAVRSTTLAWIPMATVRLTARINATRFSQDL